MAKANFVEKAQKDNQVCKKGESYWWWKLSINSPKQFSKTEPRRSQLTGSAFLSTLYDIEDKVIGKAVADSTLPETRDDIVSQLEELRDTCQESLDNMPESLQQGPTGEMLQERIDNLESAISEFEDLDLDEFDGSDVEASDREEGEDDETFKARMEQAYWDEKLEELQAICIDVS